MIKAKTLYRKLAYIGAQVNKRDLIHKVLEGGPCYLFFMSNMNIGETRPFINTLHSLLECYEMTLHKVD